MAHLQLMYLHGLTKGMYVKIELVTKVFDHNVKRL